MPVDPLFRDFYDNLGGENVLGPAISPLFPLNNLKYQYTQNSLMEYNPESAPSEKFRLANLGQDMGITEPAVSQHGTGGLYLDGHVIFAPFIPMYTKLGGIRIVGRPLTEVHFNPEKQRYEQYFENVGFYWYESDPQDAVHLLAYGVWKCDKHCPYPYQINSIVDLPNNIRNPLDDLFTEAMAQLGSDFTGFALTAAYQAPDGKIDKIYENVVLTADPANGNRVTLRRLPEAVGVLVQPPVPKSEIKGMNFFPKEVDLGYNIPQAFLDYIMAHGGLEISGPPITELALTTEQVFRQCFKYMCLDYHLLSNLPEPLRIRPAPLGYPYRDVNYKVQPPGDVIQISLDKAITMQVYVRYELILSSQMQEVSASIFMGEKPYSRVEPILVVSYPDGSQKAYYFPPTGKDGKTTKILDPIPAQNGTLVPYKVCLSTPSKDLFCVKESFVIWGNP